MLQGKSTQIRLLIMIVVMIASLGAAATPRAAATTPARPVSSRPPVTYQAATSSPLTTTLTPEVPATLVYTDTHGLRTQLDFGADAVTETTTLVFTPTHQLYLPITARDESPGNPNQAGLLDPSFDGDGKLTDVEGTVTALAIQPDGKILAAVDEFYNFTLIRYKPDGGRDTTFGQGGIVRTNFERGFDQPSSIAVQPDGKIILAGKTDDMRHPCIPCKRPEPSDVTLARYNANGTLDSSFGEGGRVFTSFDMYDIGGNLVLQPDGKILLTATSWNPFTSTVSFSASLLRYDASGNLDATFGDQGHVTIFENISFSPSALALQPDGKLVVAGMVSGVNGDPAASGLGLARFTPDGAPDTSFGDGGRIIAPGPGAADMLIQPDGKIVTVGNVYNGITIINFVLSRFQPDGTPDLTFGYQGVVSSFISFAASTVIRQPDGKLVVAGSDASRFVTDFALARYRPNGSSDLTFGEGGKVVTDFFNGFDGANGDRAYALVLQPDGKLIAAGYAMRLDSRKVVGLARYLGDPQPAP